MRKLIFVLLLLATPAMAEPHHWYSPMKNKWFWIENAAQVGMYVGMAVNSHQPCGGCKEVNTTIYGSRPVSTARVLEIGVPANIALMALNLAAWDVSRDMTGGWKVAGHIEVPAIAFGVWGGAMINDSNIRRQCLQSGLKKC